jgi:hypothetical protein
LIVKITGLFIKMIINSIPLSRRQYPVLPTAVLCISNGVRTAPQACIDVWSTWTQAPEQPSMIVARQRQQTIFDRAEVERKRGPPLADADADDWTKDEATRPAYAKLQD